MTDKAGNSASASLNNIDVDLTVPGVSITTPVNGAFYVLNQAVASDYACTDALSGINTCAGPVADGANFNTSNVGPHSFTVNATDVAGNPASLTHTYAVQYSFLGFFTPVDNLPVLNGVNAGRAIPLKREVLRDALGNPVLNLALTSRASPTCRLRAAASRSTRWNMSRMTVARQSYALRRRDTTSTGRPRRGLPIGATSCASR